MLLAGGLKRTAIVENLVIVKRTPNVQHDTMILFAGSVSVLIQTLLRRSGIDHDITNTYEAQFHLTV